VSLGRRLFAVIAVVALVVCAAACGERETADDSGFHQDIVNGSNGAEVTFDATLLNEPVQSGSHERFEVRAATGERLEIDHNIDLATYVPAHLGDGVIIHGQLYIDPGPVYGVHCTHAHTSSGCPNPGWIEYANSYYE
jgi:uncharacterized protein DUF3465